MKITDLMGIFYRKKEISEKYYNPILNEDFRGKCVVVTGGTGGIGSALVERYVYAGAYVIIHYHNLKKRAESIQKRLRKSNRGTCEIFKADLGKRTEVLNLIAFALKARKRVDIWINNAAIIPSPSDWKSISELDWDKTIALNLKGVFECSRIVGMVMLKQKYGKIVNISSLRGQFGSEDLIAYAASKAGVENLTKSFAKALSPFVQVNCVSLGRINGGLGKIHNESEEKQWAERTLLQRVGNIEDVIGAVEFLTSKKSDFITGQVLNIDGGSSIKR